MQITPEPHIPIEGINLSDISVLDRARLACNTFACLFPEDEDGAISEEEKELAREAFQAVTSPTPVFVPAIIAQYPNASLRYLDKMLSEYDYELVNSAVRIREYTKNKLLVESENPDGKIRIRALELLGKMKDVGLFTDRLEITHKTKTDAELEEELTKKIERYMGLAIVVPEEEEEQPEEEEEQLELAPKPDISAFISTLGG